MGAVSQGAQRIITYPTPTCVVLFRPHDDYKGEFGFDWLRVRDNGLATEPAYESIIESGYKDRTTDFTSVEAYASLASMKYRWFLNVFNRDFPVYSVPYLNLFYKSYSDNVKINPKPPYEAKLKVLVQECC